MAYAYTLSVLVPANTDLVSDGNEVMQNIQGAVIERLGSVFTNINTDPMTLKAAITFAGSFSQTTGTAALQAITGTTLVLSSSLTMGATQRLYLDGGGNTYIEESSADTFRVVAGGAATLTVTAALVSSAVAFTAAAIGVAGTGVATIYTDLVVGSLGGTDELHLQMGSTSGRIVFRGGDATERVTIANSGATVINAGGLTVTAGGLTVSAGTTAVQALTATTGLFTGSLTISTTIVGPVQGITLSGFSLTGSQAGAGYLYSATWNTSGIAGGLAFTVTDTASNANSLLFELLVGASSKVSVRKDGLITCAGGLTATGAIEASTTVKTSAGFLYGANQVVGARATAVADAAGGAIIDAEARTALNAFLDRARTHGLIAP